MIVMVTGGLLDSSPWGMTDVLRRPGALPRFPDIPGDAS